MVVVLIAEHSTNNVQDVTLQIVCFVFLDTPLSMRHASTVNNQINIVYNVTKHSVLGVSKKVILNRVTVSPVNPIV
jgi:hypothetical protein